MSNVGKVRGKASVLLRVTCYVLALGLYAGILVAGREFLPKLPGTSHSFFGALLGIVLVFRTNTAYDRWWEGRKLWGQLINESRNLAVKVRSCVSAPTTGKQELLQWLRLFPLVLRDHLRGPVLLRLLPGFESTTESPQHVPMYLVERIYQRIEHWRRGDVLGGFELLFLDRHAAALLDICGGCERIRKTPIAASYLNFIRQGLTIYLLTLPISLVHDLGFWSIFVTMVAGYFMIGLELLAEAVEDPFGSDAEDLKLDEMCESIARSIDQLSCECLEE